MLLRLLLVDISLATNRGEPRSRGGRGRGRRGRGRDAGPPFDEQSGPPPFAGGAYGDAPQPPPARDAFDRRDRGRERGGRGRDRDYDRAGGGGYGGRDRSPARGSGRPSARVREGEGAEAGCEWSRGSWVMSERRERES